MASLEYTRVTGEGEIGEIITRDFMPPNRSGYIRIGPEKVFLQDQYLNIADRIRDFDVREDDIWVITHPKTGTTWTQEMVWCIKNDLDFEAAKQFIGSRFPFLECASLFDPRPQPVDVPSSLIDSVQFVANMESTRFIKTHLPWSLLPQQIQSGEKTPKMVYVCRNPKDTCVSYFHHSSSGEGYSGSLENYCKLFLDGSLYFAPFWSHVLGFWKRREQPNILFLKYEDMKKDLPSVIRKTAEFLGKSLTEKEVSALADHLSFEKMRKNKAVNYEWEREDQDIQGEEHFMRGGRVGDGERDLSSEMIEKFDRMSEECFAGSGLSW